MKYLIVFMVLISAVYGVPPSGYYSPSYSQVTVQRSIEVPYPPNNAPAGQSRVSTRQQTAPKPTYGPPAPSYGPPAPSYGPPPQNTTQANNATATEYPATTEALSEQVDEGRPQRIGDDSVERGVYYIYHPSGLLQKVVYATKDDMKNMAYLAKLKYENVEPIREPIYTYDPNTFVLQRIQARR